MSVRPVNDAPGSRRPGARELAREAMTAQIAEMALDLFVQRGYDATTVEDICAVAGISRTSFFRYFRTKEDVLMRDFDPLGDLLLASLTSQPDDEAAWAALRAALGSLAGRYGAGDVHTRRVLKLVIETPSLNAFHHEKLSRWVAQLRPEMSRRLGADPSDPTDPAPNALISAAFACLDAALVAWVAAEGTSTLDVLLDRAMSTFGAELAAPEGDAPRSQSG